MVSIGRAGAGGAYRRRVTTEKGVDAWRRTGRRGSKHPGSTSAGPDQGWGRRRCDSIFEGSTGRIVGRARRGGPRDSAGRPESPVWPARVQRRRQCQWRSRPGRSWSTKTGFTTTLRVAEGALTSGADVQALPGRPGSPPPHRTRRPAAEPLPISGGRRATRTEEPARPSGGPLSALPPHQHVDPAIRDGRSGSREAS
jgi:hypothetical protein